MTDPDFFKWFATLGVGGVLAAFMFVFYRKDVKTYTEMWRLTSERMMDIIQENTASNIKLIVLLETMERNSRRIADLHSDK